MESKCDTDLDEACTKARRLIESKKKKTKQRTAVYSYPVSAGSMYYGMGSSDQDGDSDGGGE